MNHMFLGITLGGDPHTLGIYNAGKIAKMMGIPFNVVPPDTSISRKIELIKEYNPRYLGLSYRLSTDQGTVELMRFLKEMEKAGLFNEEYANRKICFAALPNTLKAVLSTEMPERYHLVLMGQSKNRVETDLETIKFFEPTSDDMVTTILDKLRVENEPERIEILDQIARDIVNENNYWDMPALAEPSDAAKKSFQKRIEESPIPVIRTHFGIPDKTIDPTVEGIIKISNAGVVDEISLGSSDLSQRYFGDHLKFLELKNDGGVPYKDQGDLERLYQATRGGNYPSLKPYCHVTNMVEFADTCWETGLLKGAHQAVPLFWFSELDGRGPLSVDDVIDEHIELVKHLKTFNIPVEMNDPNQWSSRFCHDTIFVSDYALIASVMYNCGIRDMVFQMQFNKPAVTGDYGDLAKMMTAKKLISTVLPKDAQLNTYIETRSGIEHFSTDLEHAKFQLVRSTLLQMLMNPSIIHLVSYCEAVHAATPEDIIESSKIVRTAVKYFKQNEMDIRKEASKPFVEKRKEFLFQESMDLLQAIASLNGENNDCLYKNLANPSNLKAAMRKRYMTAPGIMNSNYKNDNIITKTGEYGVIDCYETWESSEPLRENQRIRILEKEKND